MKAQISSLRRDTGQRPPVRPRTGSSVVQGAGSQSAGSYCSGLVRQMIDPCHAPALAVPDKYSGSAKFLMVKSVTPVNFALDASGYRGAIIHAGSVNSLELSGAAAYGTWTQQNDGQAATELAGANYRYIRVVGMCVELTSLSPTTSSVPEVRQFCTPALLNTARTAYGVGYASQRYEDLVTRDPMSFGWCPRSIDDFVPCAPATVWNGGARADGSLTDNVPSIHLDISGSAAANMMLVITRVFQAFLNPAYELRSSNESFSNVSIVEKAITAVQQVPMHASGEDLGSKITAFADKVAKFVQSPAVQSALEIGKKILPTLLAGIL